MKEPDIVVSDHAIVRYIERHYNFSVEPIRKEIAKLVQGAAAAGANSYSVEGITFCLEKSTKKTGLIVVTTTLERSMKRQTWLKNHKG